MKIIEINSVNSGSTGNIMIGIAEIAAKQGHEVLICVPKSRGNLTRKLENQILIGNRLSRNIHLALGTLTGYQGMFSVLSTYHFIRHLKKENPDLIHLHNLHNCYINLPMLFGYIKKQEIPVVWTLHDCWAMTGQCPYFTMAKCEKWKTGCHDCPQLDIYPASKVDRTATMWRLKKKWFTGIKNLTIVTPSKWLAGIVSESYLKSYPVKVIYNGIDLNVFKPRTSNFRSKYHIENQYIILGVAAGWGKRKGLDVFIELASKLDDRYQIVLVGTSEETKLPENIISIHHTQNQQELAEIYTAADIFVNPTREEVLGLVNIEALACGTPVITFDTGGSPECIDVTCGRIIPVDDIETLVNEITNICTQTPYSEKSCIKRANQFAKRERFTDYIILYEHLNKKI